MKRAQPGDLVSVVYDGSLDNKEIFESSKETGPLDFTIGTGQVMPEFEKNIIGMAEGETKTFTLPPEAGHGPHNPDLVHRIAKKGLKDKDSIKPGMVLGLDLEKDGETHKVPAMVTKVDAKNIVVDFNHPLAGQALTYTVSLQSIKNAQSA